MVARKKLAVVGVVVVLAVIGVVIGVIVSRQSSDSASTSTSDSTSSSSSSSGSGTSTSSDTTSSSSGNAKVKSSSSTSSSSGSTTITSDPTSVTYSLAAFAIGDWGSTVQPDSCCTRSSTYDDYDIVAEDVVATIMNTQAGDADVTPKVIISHG
jgi:tartrate-resistant acid phosphatase type 5